MRIILLPMRRLDQPVLDAGSTTSSILYDVILLSYREDEDSTALKVRYATRRS
jgi:hypothetical protein